MKRNTKRILALIYFSTIMLISFVACSYDPIQNESETVSEESSIPSDFKLASVELKTTFGMIKSEYIYNEKGLVSELKQYDNGKVYRIEAITYDDKNNISVKTISMPEDTTLNTTETYFYSTDNVLERYESKCGQTINTFSYEYDEQGRIKKITQSDGESVLQEKVYEYLDEYGSCRTIFDGTRIQETYYDEKKGVIRSYSGNTDGTVYDDVFCANTYEKGRIVKSVATASDEIQSVTTYEYDEYGNLLEERQLNAAGTPVSTTTYTWIAK